MSYIFHDPDCSTFTVFKTFKVNNIDTTHINVVYYDYTYAILLTLGETYTPTNNYKTLISRAKMNYPYITMEWNCN